MSKKNTVVLVLTVSAFLVAGVILASNMAFKVNYPLNKAGSNGNQSGTQTLGLPDVRQTGLNSSFQLIQDIEGGGPAFSKVISVAKCLTPTDTLQVYTGRMGSPGTDFALSPTECYQVQMSADVNYTIWGSHDPAFARQLLKAGPGSKSGTNCYAPPTNIIPRNAFAVMQDIEGGGPPFSKVISIGKYVTGTGGLQVYTGRMGSPGANYNIVPGECYKIQMSQTVSYIASHY